jgi:hypothetical protein
VDVQAFGSAIQALSNKVYDELEDLIAVRDLYQNDVVVIPDGGLGFNILEDTVLLEIKQGPYPWRRRQKLSKINFVYNRTQPWVAHAKNGPSGPFALSLPLCWLNGFRAGPPQPQHDHPEVKCIRHYLGQRRTAVVAK